MPGSTLLAPVSLPRNGILHLVPLGLVKAGNTKLHPSKTCTMVRNPYLLVVVFVSLAAHCPLGGWLMIMRASKLVLSNSFGSARTLSYMRRMSKIPTHLSTVRVSIQSAGCFSLLRIFSFSSRFRCPPGDIFHLSEKFDYRYHPSPG